MFLDFIMAFLTHGTHRSDIEALTQGTSPSPHSGLVPHFLSNFWSSQMLFPGKPGRHWKHRDETIRFLPSTGSSNVKWKISIFCSLTMSLCFFNSPQSQVKTTYTELSPPCCNARVAFIILFPEILYFFPYFTVFLISSSSVPITWKASFIPLRQTHYIYHICNASASGLSFKAQYKKLCNLSRVECPENAIELEENNLKVITLNQDNF